MIVEWQYWDQQLSNDYNIIIFYCIAHRNKNMIIHFNDAFPRKVGVCVCVFMCEDAKNGIELYAE